MTASEKLSLVRSKLLTREPFYGFMAIDIIWIESDMGWIDNPKNKTLGVLLRADSTIECHFYPKWVNETPAEKLYGAIEHMIGHLVRLHPVRGSDKDPEIWGMSTDYVVNGQYESPRIGFQGAGQLILPFDNMKFIPSDWDNSLSAEKYYEMLTDGKGGKPKAGGKNSQSVDDHSIWKRNEISAEEATNLIANRVQNAINKSQGNIPGNLKTAIEDLKEAKVNWKDVLRQWIGNHVGGIRRTYNRPDRRTDKFGVKGISHHAADKVTVYVDSSGSISIAELEQFFSEIESMLCRAKVSVIIWDAALQGYFKVYRRGMYKQIRISGGGGTDMSAPLKWAEKNGAVNHIGVMLTDGEVSEWPDRRPYPFMFCITTPSNQTSGPDWGTVIRINVNKK